MSTPSMRAEQARLTRRTFLRLALISGAVVGCGRTGRQQAVTTPAPAPPLPTGTLALDLRFALENESVSYAARPLDCSATIIEGTVRDVSGSPQAGITIRMWSVDPAQAVAFVTDADGWYSVIAAAGVVNTTFYLQIVDAAGTTLLSDVVAVQAIPDCTHNVMTVNFTATR